MPDDAPAASAATPPKELICGARALLRAKMNTYGCGDRPPSPPAWMLEMDLLLSDAIVSVCRAAGAAAPPQQRPPNGLKVVGFDHSAAGPIWVLHMPMRERISINEMQAVLDVAAGAGAATPASTLTAEEAAAPSPAATPPRQPCPECDGKGTVVKTDGDEFATPYRAQCEACNSTGIARGQQRKEPTP